MSLYDAFQSFSTVVQDDSVPITLTSTYCMGKQNPLHILFGLSSVMSDSVDEIAMNNLPSFLLTEPVAALRATGDGACLFNAISIAIFGNEKRSEYLRQLYQNELISNMEWYKEKAPTEPWESQLESSTNPLNYMFASDIFVIANAIKRPIILYAPDSVVEFEERAENGAASTYLPTRHGPECCQTKRPITISWNSISLNHFVPIVPKKKDGLEFIRWEAPTTAFQSSLGPGHTFRDYLHWRLAPVNPIKTDKITPVVIKYGNHLYRFYVSDTYSLLPLSDEDFLFDHSPDHFRETIKSFVQRMIMGFDWESKVKIFRKISATRVPAHETATQELEPINPIEHMSHAKIAKRLEDKPFASRLFSKLPASWDDDSLICLSEALTEASPQGDALFPLIDLVRNFVMLSYNMESKVANLAAFRVGDPHNIIESMVKAMAPHTRPPLSHEKTSQTVVFLTIATLSTLCARPETSLLMLSYHRPILSLCDFAFSSIAGSSHLPIESILDSTACKYAVSLLSNYSKIVLRNSTGLSVNHIIELIMVTIKILGFLVVIQTKITEEDQKKKNKELADKISESLAFVLAYTFLSAKLAFFVTECSFRPSVAALSDRLLTTFGASPIQQRLRDIIKLTDKPPTE